MSGEFRIPATRETVWSALNDPAVLQQCIPGCEALERISDTEFTAKMLAKVGPVKSKFDTKLAISELKPPQSYTISGEGKGGAAGFAKGGAEVRLAEDGEGTVLSYTANVQVGGKLAQVGSRLIDGTGRKLANEFFANFSEVVAPAPAAEDEEPGETKTLETLAMPAEPARSDAQRNLVSRILWIIAVIAIAGFAWWSMNR